MIPRDRQREADRQRERGREERSYGEIDDWVDENINTDGYRGPFGDFNVIYINQKTKQKNLRKRKEKKFIDKTIRYKKR